MLIFSESFQSTVELLFCVDTDRKYKVLKEGLFIKVLEYFYMKSDIFTQLILVLSIITSASPLFNTSSFWSICFTAPYQGKGMDNPVLSYLTPNRNPISQASSGTRPG